MSSKLLSVLAIETTSQACSAAVAIDGQVVADRFKDMSSGQSEALFPMIKEIFFESETQFKDLDIVAVTCGPGTFTGVRVGLAAAHGIALAKNIPIFSATTLEVLTFEALINEKPEFPIVSIINARKDIYYIQIFSSAGQELCSPKLLVQGKICEIFRGIDFSTNKIFLAGNGDSRLVKELSNNGWECIQSTVSSRPNAYWLARLAINKTQNIGLNGSRKFPEPFYLQVLDAKPAKNGGRLRPI